MNNETKKTIDTSLKDTVVENKQVGQKTSSKDSNTNNYEQISVFVDNKSNTTNQKHEKKQAVTIPKGHILEYRIKRLLFAMGYYPKVGIIIKASQSEQADTITDLDVFGIYIHKNFTSKTIWADCKSGSYRPLERISWINGVKQFIKTDDILFIKKNVRISTKQFARNSGIQILDENILEKLEHDFNVAKSDWRGSWNPYSQFNQLKTFQQIDVPSIDIYKKIANFITSDYWTLDNFAQIKKTLTALKQLSVSEQLPLSQKQLTSIKWVILELVNLFTLSLLNVCKEIYYFSDIEKKEVILDGLISGEISAKKRAEIVEATYRVAYSMIQKQLPDTTKLSIQIPNLVMNPPIYAEALYDLLLRVTNHSLEYHDILRFLDFTFMEYDLKSKDIDEVVLKELFKNYDDLVLSSKTILHFICDVTEISRDVFKLLH